MLWEGTSALPPHPKRGAGAIAVPVVVVHDAVGDQRCVHRGLADGVGDGIVVVGSVLYEGAFTLEEAMAAV